MRPIALLFAVAACGSGAPAPTAPPPPPTPTETARAAKPGYDAERWRAIKAAKGAVDGDARALVPELVELLGATDPALRDGVGYEVVAMWSAPDGPLGVDGTRELASALRVELRDGLPGAGESDATFQRSFAALGLAEIARRDAQAPILSDAQLDALVADAVWYANNEEDFRGHTGATGWCHAAAHTGDLLKFLARNPRVGGDGPARILGALAALVGRRHAYIFHHGEELRLSAPVVELLQRDAITAEQFAAWLQQVAAPLGERATNFDLALYAAQRNSTSLLMALLTRFTMAVDPPAAVASARQALVALLRS